MKSYDGTVIEVYVSDDNTIHVETTDLVTPRLMQIGIGEFSEGKISVDVIKGLIASAGNISSVVLPNKIPTSLVYLFMPLVELEAPIHWAEPGKSGFDLQAYYATVGHFPDDIRMHPGEKKEVVDVSNIQKVGQFPEYSPQYGTGTPMPNLGTNITRSNIAPADGFVELVSDIPEFDSVPSGLHTPTTADIPTGVSDGFTDISDIDGVGESDKPVPGVEKRTLWTEDVDRMNRLGYLPIAAARDERTFPKELGGGRIR